MNVQIPMAGLTLSDGQTYNGQLPVWATRPLMIRVTPDFISGNEYPIYVRVSNGGAIKKEITLPYQEEAYLDLSFAAPLLRRADRNVSEGDPAFPQQEVEIWSSNLANKITLPVFHCDETYWDTLGVDGALPQPPKPRIPNQTLDIYFPYRVHPLDAFQVDVEPVAGAPSDVIFPTTYVLGNTIDIKYIKKLTIKNVWGSGLDQVINYEDRLMSDVVHDESMQCALRARWNMRNGQWFWAAFKDYFWSNKFTPIRGRGGVTEQAELTINLEYGEEWYNVYQELLVSSNVVFDLNLPGINQYQNKRFRAEVSGDTGARWSNSTKTYRQRVRFRTTELTDNYMFPPAPDQPPTPSIAFTAQKNPWTVGAAYAEGLANSVYSNAAWGVQSEPSWLTVTNGTTLLTPDLFEQGSALATPGLTWEQAKASTPNGIRTKKAFTTGNEIYSLISGVPGYMVTFVYLNADGTISANTPWISINGRVNTGTYQKIGMIIKKTDATEITPADITTLNAYWGKRYHQFPAGASNLTATVAANTGEAITGNIVLKSEAGSTTYTIPVTQQKATGNITATPSTIAAGYVHMPATVAVTSVGNWSVPECDPWITPSVLEGWGGTTTVTLTIADNTSNDGRTGTIRFYNHIAREFATVTVNQTGAPASVGIDPARVTAPKTSGTVRRVSCGSTNGWAMIEKPSWVVVSPNNYAAGIVQVSITYTANSTGTKRSGYLKVKENVTGEIAICIIEQEG